MLCELLKLGMVVGVGYYCSGNDVEQEKAKDVMDLKRAKYGFTSQ